MFQKDKLVVFDELSLDLKMETLEFKWENLFDLATFMLRHEYLMSQHDPQYDKI